MMPDIEGYKRAKAQYEEFKTWYEGFRNNTNRLEAKNIIAEFYKNDMSSPIPVEFRRILADKINQHLSEEVLASILDDLEREVVARVPELIRELQEFLATLNTPEKRPYNE